MRKSLEKKIFALTALFLTALMVSVPGTAEGLTNDPLNGTWRITSGNLIHNGEIIGTYTPGSASDFFIEVAEEEAGYRINVEGGRYSFDFENGAKSPGNNIYYGTVQRVAAGEYRHYNSYIDDPLDILTNVTSEYVYKVTGNRLEYNSTSTSNEVGKLTQSLILQRLSDTGELIDDEYDEDDEEDSVVGLVDDPLNGRWRITSGTLTTTGSGGSATGSYIPGSSSDAIIEVDESNYEPAGSYSIKAYSVEDGKEAWFSCNLNGTPIPAYLHSSPNNFLRAAAGEYHYGEIVSGIAPVNTMYKVTGNQLQYIFNQAPGTTWSLTLQRVSDIGEPTDGEEDSVSGGGGGGGCNAGFMGLAVLLMFSIVKSGKIIKS